MTGPIAAAKQQFSQDKAGFPVCHCPARAISLKEWCDLVRHKPPDKVMAELKARGFSLHNIEDAAGSGINIDYYPVTVTEMPIVDGRRLTPDELQSYWRQHPDQFFDPGYADFHPLPGADSARWASNDPLGTVVNIDMGMGGRGVADWLDNIDDGSVVASQVTNRNWIFSTVYTPGVDWSHPVSGNREFGYTSFGPNQTVFYTRGADRLTTSIDANMEILSNPWLGGRTTGHMRSLTDSLLNPGMPMKYTGDAGIAFGTADKLWSNFQQRMAKFVNDNGGQATIGPRVSDRYDWAQMKRFCGM